MAEQTLDNFAITSIRLPPETPVELSFPGEDCFSTLLHELDSHLSQPRESSDLFSTRLTINLLLSLCHAISSSKDPDRPARLVSDMEDHYREIVFTPTSGLCIDMGAKPGLCDDGFGDLTTILPLLLAKLRPWRLLGPLHSQQRSSLVELASSLAGLTHKSPGTGSQHQLSVTRGERWLGKATELDGLNAHLSGESVPTVAIPMYEHHDACSNFKGEPPASAADPSTQSCGTSLPKFSTIFRNGCPACRVLRSPSLAATVPINDSQLNAQPRAWAPRIVSSDRFETIKPVRVPRGRLAPRNNASRSGSIDESKENKPPVNRMRSTSSQLPRPTLTQPRPSLADASSKKGQVRTQPPSKPIANAPAIQRNKSAGGAPSVALVKSVLESNNTG